MIDLGQNIGALADHLVINQKMSIDQDFCLAYSRCLKVPTDVGTVTKNLLLPWLDRYGILIILIINVG
ncbi:MAG: hypothetical protein DDT18_01300 [Actinobacteria bacterium]|uniref:Uncharacterized protein n=1 Tax=Candidatus Hakubella thermalkaliphila TaxID=2754717 RepID=A0A6V8P206_9ACTN|nr:hypothetical protein [Actinomycetota bacterium]GFP25411.1 hypothetical protein HKBW3S25_00883 [Candidatus Hakubella thermalkaliphila]